MNFFNHSGKDREQETVRVRQYKNDAIQLKKSPILKLPRFFSRRVGE